MKQTFQGRCHCGRVTFAVRAILDHLRVCNCSICHMRGAMIHRVAEEDLQLLTPLDQMTRYQWGSMTGADYFCPTCGILPFRRPSAPTAAEITKGIKPFSGWAVNARCLVGVDPTNIPIQLVNGRDI